MILVYLKGKIWYSYLPSDVEYSFRKVTLHTFLLLLFFLFVVDFVIHWNETSMGLHVFPIPIPPPTSLSTRSL